MTDAEILNTLKEGIAEVAPRKAAALTDPQPTMALADLGLDSVSLMEVFGYLEETLDLYLPEEKLTELRTLGDVIALVHASQ
ncbi:MAG: acyl carrier protein [Bradymonadia bacterium]